MESLKIVEGCPFFYPRDGGIEKRMHVTSKLFAERGHDVTVLTAQLPGTPLEEETEYGYRIIRLPSKFIDIYNPPFVSTKGVLEKLGELRPDIINYNYRWAPSFDKDVANYPGKKVFTYHNMWGEGSGLTGAFSEFSDNRFRKQLLKYDHIVAISDAVKMDLVARGIDEGTITTIDNALETFPDITGIEEDYILSLGRLVSTKGLDDLIVAMRDVDCKLVLCGKGPMEKKLRKMVSRYNLEEKVDIRGWVEEDEKIRLMSNCKFFVMPSIYEAYGLAALEAISYGKPIVCTDVDGLPGNVKSAGYYIKPKDPTGLAKAMNDLLDHPDKRRTYSEEAIKVSRAVTWDEQIRKTEDLYRSIVNG